MFLEPSSCRQSQRVLIALYHPVRLSLLETLHRYRHLTVMALCRLLGMERTMLSMHLRVLREAGFVRTERNGHEIYYSLHHKRLALVNRLVKGL